MSFCVFSILVLTAAARLLASSWHTSGKIFYFFLGDLITQLLKLPATTATNPNETLGTLMEKATPNFKFLFGPTSFTHPLLSTGTSDSLGNTSAATMGNITYRAGSNNSSVNLFFLPIHVETYMNFITEKIVGEGRQSYPLMSFVEDFIQYLMNDVMSSRETPASATRSGRIAVDLIPRTSPRTL